MALRPIGGARRNAAIQTETADDRTERQQLRQFRADLQVILDGWDAASNAQRFAGTKETIRTLRRVLRLV